MAQVFSSGGAAKRSREEWHRLFVAEKAKGANGLAIARIFGIGSSFVYDVLNDPTGAKIKRRRRKYGLRCLGCGKRTDGSNGREAPRFCLACANLRRKPKHGTASRYSGGCRCDACKRANAERMRDYSFRTGRTSRKYAHRYTPYTGRCRECECLYDEKMPGCKTCYARHYRRAYSA